MCELGSETTFNGRWKQALEAAFEDMKVPLACLPADVVPRLQRIKDDAWDRTLDAVEFVCDTELHFQSDLRIVQRELNEFPHDHPPHYAPVVAVRRLFGLRRVATARRAEAIIRSQRCRDLKRGCEARSRVFHRCCSQPRTVCSNVARNSRPRWRV